MVNSPTSRLGTALDVVTAPVEEKVGWFRRRLVGREFEYLDWTVDGVALRELVRWPTGEVAEEVTPLLNDYSQPGLAVAYLRTLQGSEDDPAWETQMPDGRIVVLFCHVDFDLACRTLTAELVLHEDTVEWRDIGWQVSYETLDLSEQECPVISLIFDRSQYEDVLHGLLVEEAGRG